MEPHSPENEVANGLVKFYASTSERGKVVLLWNGFGYVFDKCSKRAQGGEFWRCRKKSPYCPGRIAVYGDWLEQGKGRFKVGAVLNGGHNHRPPEEHFRVDPQIVPRVGANQQS